MTLEIEVSGNKLTVSLDDELTIYTVNHFRDLLTEQLRDITHITVNLSKVSEIDSAGLQLLIAIKNLNSDYEVEFIEHSIVVEDVLSICGLSGQFNDSVLIFRESQQ